MLSSFDSDFPGKYSRSFTALDPWRTKEGAKEQPGAVDRIIDELMQKAPILIQAKAVVVQAQADLEQAELNFSYTDVWAEIDGVITRRNVNKREQCHGRAEFDGDSLADGNLDRRQFQGDATWPRLAIGQSLGENPKMTAYTFQWQGTTGTKFVQVNPVGDPNSVKIVYPKPAWGK